MKKLTFIILLNATVFFPSSVLANVIPADVVGRSLNYPGISWAGHVGIATVPYDDRDNASYVIEALNEPVVLQINTLKNFRNRSDFWGVKYGYTDDYTRQLRIISEGEFQESFKCAEYTVTASYRPGSGQWGAAKTCPIFRCDTLVNYLYWWGGYILPTYNPPGKLGNATLPKYVYDAIPYQRSSKATAKVPYVLTLTQPVNFNRLNENNINDLESMDLNEFMSAVDFPEETITEKGVDSIFMLLESFRLSREKNLFLLDKLGFLVTADSLEKLIALYNNNQLDADVAHMIIRDTQALYQNSHFLKDSPRKKQLLLTFYLEQINSKLSPSTKSIVIRGIISLATDVVILKHKAELDSVLNCPEIDDGVRLTLKITLANKSKKLGEIYFPEIVSDLHYGNNVRLKALFMKSVLSKVICNGVDSLDPASRKLISLFLKEYKLTTDKYTTENKDLVFPQDKGAWLEASALVNYSSLKEAGHYIGEYFQKINEDEQMNYVLGFSHEKYLRVAFDVEPALLDFKNKHSQLYNNIIDIRRRSCVSDR